MTTQLQTEIEFERIHQGDCLDILTEMKDLSVDLVFADPPFNIGYEYDEYHDKQEDDQYLSWSAKWMAEVFRVLKPNGTFWLAIGDEYAAELKVAAKELKFATRSWVVWYYTFGVNCTKKFSRSHVHLFQFVKDENSFTFNADQIRVPSARALVYADKRANPNGRLPDDTWILRPQDLPKSFDPIDDTWYFARVAGTCAERQGFHGCQMPEQLLGRIVRVSSNPDDVVLDPFAGSGTTLAVAKKLGRKWIGCELSDVYVRAATERLNAINVGDSLDGPANPVASAPSTANGRKLEDRVLESQPAEQPNVDINTASSGLEFERDAAVHAKVSISAVTKRALRDVINDAIVNAFYSSNDGHSIDWLLADAKLQNDFHRSCRESGLIGNEFDWNKKLLRLRKSGHFPKEGEVKRISFSASEMDEFRFVAEIAWRSTREKFKNASLDDILCDPAMAAYFDRTAKRYSLNFNSTGCRWAALGLRKASKTLVDDMKQFQFIFQTRKFPNRGTDWKRLKVGRYSGQPGIYMLRGGEKEPLFVDNTIDLGARLTWHAGCNSLLSVVKEVVILPPDELPGEKYEDAFKVDLVRRYDPSLNVNLSGLVESLAI